VIRAEATNISPAPMLVEIRSGDSAVEGPVSPVSVRAVASESTPPEVDSPAVAEASASHDSLHVVVAAASSVVASTLSSATDYCRLAARSW
jgi:hypothetical protein